MGDLRKPDVVTVLVSRVDGGVTILRLIETEYQPKLDEAGRPTGGEREVRWYSKVDSARVERTIAKHNWQGGLAPVSWRFAPNDILTDQTDATFRDAWRDTGDPSHRLDHEMVDMPKAREIHRQRMRKARAARLEALDTEYMQADERGDSQAKKVIADRKQALRDVTTDPAIEAAATPTELKAVWPDILKE